MAEAVSRPPPKPVRAGERFGGKYDLVRRIGQGGMGAVWVARNELTGADVALKVLRPQGAEVDDAVKRFRYEARLGSMLHHRSITRAFDLIEESDGTLVLVMELLRGETLQAYLHQKETLTAREAVAIAVPILSALDHAHEMGIIHRDVKPANVYLSIEPDGHVIPKLLDFGIAKGHAIHVHTLEGKVLGTPAYMSPEQIRATTNELTGRSDLFSMGVVLYEMLTGKPPFDPRVPSAALAAVLEEPVDPDPRIEPRLWLEIERALAKRPAERHASAREMAQALCDAVGETEEALAGSLRRSKPPPVLPPESLPPTPTIGGNETINTNQLSVSRSISTKRRSAPRAWIAGALAVATLALVITTVSLTRSHAPAPSAGGPPSASSSPVPEPSQSDPAATIELTSADPPGSASAQPRTPAHAKPRPKIKPKPIATTPGF